MADIRYVCTGPCGGFVVEEDYEKGKKTCQEPNCSKHGEPLEKRLYCPKCDVYFKEGEEHSCE
ncbi:MAG: hypothetical protein GF409_07775 [Candidatus Omnitrophica bacterium]|nr:hypothetical protein [Candidatus Omnitrophota bacterium]